MIRLRARVRFNGSDAGAGTLEYLGIILLAGLVVMGLLLSATPIGSKLAEKMCEAFGTSCPANTAESDRNAPPIRSCEREASTVEGGITGSVAFVNGERNRSVTTTELSDGTYVVEVVDDGGIGAELGAGELDISLAIGDDFEAGVGLNAAIGANLTGGVGEEYHFDNEQDMKDFVDYVGRQTIADGFSIAATGPLQPIFDWGGKTVNWIINKFKGYDPPSADVTHYFGGIEGRGGGTANALIAGGRGEAEAAMVLGGKFDNETGEYTEYVDMSAAIEGDARFGMSSTRLDLGDGISGSAETSSIMEASYDSNGELSNLSIIRSGSKEVDGSIPESLGITDAAAEGNGYREQFDIPVTDANREQMQAIADYTRIPANPIPDMQKLERAIETLEYEIENNADHTYEELQVDTSNILSIGLAGKLPVVGGGGIGFESGTTDVSVVDARYETPSGWKTWDACLD